MTNTTTFGNVIDKVHVNSINHFDEVMPVHEMSFDSLNQMWISGKQVPVALTAQRLLSNRLRVPYSYLSRCPAELQAQNLNYWIEQESQRRETFFCRFNGDTLRAIFTERYKPLDNMEILGQIIEQGFNNTNLKVQYSLDHGMFLLKIPEFSKAFGVNSGHGPLDEIVPGLAFTNSEVGLIAFSIESYFYRLVCTNGLISVAKASSKKFKSAPRGWRTSLKACLLSWTTQSVIKMPSNYLASPMWITQWLPLKVSASVLGCLKMK